MDCGEKIKSLLAGLLKTLDALKLADKDSIVCCGTAMEALIEQLMPSKPPTDLLVLALETLQKAYQDSLPDVAAVEAIFATLGPAVQAALDRQPEQSNELLARLQAAVGNKAQTPGPAANDAGNPAPVNISLSDLAARLVGLGNTDRQELAEVVSQLKAYVADHADNLFAAEAARYVESAMSADEAGAGQELDRANLVLDSALKFAEGTANVSSPAATAAPAATTSQPQPAPAAKSAPAAPAIDLSVGEVRLPADTDPTLLNEYIAECLDHINNAEGSLLDIESKPDDNEGINRVFRAFHTIKGTSGFLGLLNIMKLAHLAESLLDRCRNGEIRMAGVYADLSLKSCDMLKGMIEGLKNMGGGDLVPEPEGFMSMLQNLSNPEAIVAEEDGASMRVGEILVGKGQVQPQQVQQALAEQIATDKPIGQVLIESGATSATEVAQALRMQKKMATGGGEQSGQAGATVRVGTERLDNLINMVGELVIAQSMVSQDPVVSNGSSPRLSRSVSHTGKIIRELQDLTMSLRMVPLKPTFQKMMRLVRDLGHKSNKAVEFVTEGDDTEIDRNMVEILNDPLVHMIRNSVDHGIELSADRSAKGKSATGTVTLRAYHSAGNVVIELTDDGKGLDRQKIVAKAVQRGLVQAGTELSDSEIFGLIFLPGFSTADKVTDVSGRGVGMDVVKKNVEALRGRVDVTSTLGRGTTFTLRLPLTMAIADGMLLRVGHERYLLPTVSIARSFQPAAGSVTTVFGENAEKAAAGDLKSHGEMVRLRDELIPLFRLHRLFNISDAITDPYKGLVVVIEAEAKRCALMVDELLGQQQVVIKSLGQSLGQVPGLAGGAILGDGKVGLILDAAGLIRLARGQAEQSLRAA